MRYIKYFLNVLVLCLVLTGCQSGNKKEEPVINELKLQNGDKVKIELTEGVTLDTVAEIPDINLDAVGMYHTVIDAFDGQKLIPALLGSMPENVEVKEQESAGRGYYYQGNLGDEWNNMQGFVMADGMAYIQTEHWNEISSYFPVTYMEPEIRIEIDAATKDDDFSFSSRKEASDVAGQYIKKITGFEDVRMYQAYSFNHQQMEKSQNEIISLPENELMKSDDRPMREWKEEDNCYWMFFEQFLDGIPVLSNPVTRQDDLYIPASQTEVGYTRNGMEFISFGQNYKVLNERIVKLVSIQQIYETLREKFEMAVVDEITIDQMKLIYYPLSTKFNEKEQWECNMIPAWQFRIREEENSNYIYIDAVENKEIIG